MTDPITSPANPRVKDLVRLRTQRRAREESGRFVVEGAREVDRALAGGVTIEALYACPGRAGAAHRPDLLQRAAVAGADIVELGREAFAKASYRNDGAGIIAVGKAFPLSLGRLDPRGDGLVLVVERVEKPGNLGAILRSAAAAGVDAAVVCEPATDVFNPNAIRSSLGAVFTVPLAVAASAATRDWLDERGITWHASSVRGSRPYWEAPLAEGAALVVGGEQAGLSPGWLADPARTVVIPTPGPLASLNASVAAALLLFEAVRQRAAS